MNMDFLTLGETAYNIYISSIKKYNSQLKEIYNLVITNTAQIKETNNIAKSYQEEVRLIQKSIVEQEYIRDNFEDRFKYFQLHGKELQDLLTSLKVPDDIAFKYWSKMINGIKDEKGTTLSDIYAYLYARLNEQILNLKENYLTKQQLTNQIRDRINLIRSNQTNSIRSSLDLNSEKRSFIEYFQSLLGTSIEGAKQLPNDLNELFPFVRFNEEELAYLQVIVAYPSLTIKDKVFQDTEDMHKYTFLTEPDGPELISPKQVDNDLTKVSSMDDINKFLEENKLNIRDLIKEDRDYIYSHGNVNNMTQVLAKIGSFKKFKKDLSLNLKVLVNSTGSWIDEYTNFCIQEHLHIEEIPLVCLGINPNIFSANVKSFKEENYDISDILAVCPSCLFTSKVGDVKRKLNLFKAYKIDKVRGSNLSKRDSAYQIFNISYETLMNSYFTAEEEDILPLFQLSPSIIRNSLKRTIGITRYCRINNIQTRSEREGGNYCDFYYSNDKLKRQIPALTPEAITKLIPSLAEVNTNIIASFDNEEEVKAINEFYKPRNKENKKELTVTEMFNYQTSLLRFMEYNPSEDQICNIDGCRVSVTRVKTALYALAGSISHFNVDKALGAAIFCGSMHSKQEIDHVKQAICPTLEAKI
ncbi:MAG: hypothetical protein RSA48_01355 [Bacilli bacterium]